MGSQLRFRRGDVVPLRRRNLYLPDYRAAFACSHFRTRIAIGPSCDGLSLARSATGLPCSAEMTRSVRSALYAGSVVYSWQRIRKPRHSLQEEPRSMLGSLRLTTLTSI